jgi:hypothetical protein
MKAQAFRAFLEKQAIRTAAKFAELTGVNRNTSQEYFALADAEQDVPVKRTVALAMSAIAQGLKPWDEYER